jgi:TonB family protein
MKITVPDPCSENWQAMTPGEQGKFCQRCCKAVIDFTNKANGEIIEVLAKGNKVCGKFRTEQLSPVTPLGRWKRLRAFAFALVCVFGTTLFSCTNHNTTVGEPGFTTGDSVSISPEQLRTDSLKADSLAKAVADTIPGKKEEKPVTEESAWGTGKKKGSEQQAGDSTQQQPRHYPLPLPPRWAGGDRTAMEKFISSNTKYPDDAKKNNVKGIVYVEFIVTTNGEGKNYHVFKGLGHGCDEEAVRVAKLLKWEPGKQGGKNMDMEYSISVPFGE